MRPVSLAISIAVAILSTSLSARAQSSSTTYLNERTLPDAGVYLPAPALPDSPLISGDVAYYQWGKTIRPTDRGQRAHDEANSSLDYLCEIFCPAVGIRIGKDATPKLYKLLSRANSTSLQATHAAKDHYRRVRPFDHFKEGTGVPENEKSYSGSPSYPSGHSTRGWTIALVLTELFPERANEILKVGYEYGESRVIVGYHWESDVQAARVASSASVAAMHSDRTFLKDMKKARKEIDGLKH